MSNDTVIAGVMILTLIVVHILRKWSVGALVAFILLLLSENQIIKNICFVSFILLLCIDGKRKGKESIFSKYNVYSKDCVFSRRVVVIVKIIGTIVSALALIGFLLGYR